MVEVFLVLANGAAGKSATVRALTGARVKGTFPIEIGKARKVEDCFIEIRSLQESDRYKTPKKFIEAVRKSKCNFAIVALRLNAYNSRPCAQEYIDAIKNEGWEVSGACEISDTEFDINYRSEISPVRVPPQDSGRSANQRAAAVREVWPIS